MSLMDFTRRATSSQAFDKDQTTLVTRGFSFTHNVASSSIRRMQLYDVDLYYGVSSEQLIKYQLCPVERPHPIFAYLYSLSSNGVLILIFLWIKPCGNYNPQISCFHPILDSFPYLGRIRRLNFEFLFFKTPDEKS